MFLVSVSQDRRFGRPGKFLKALGLILVIKALLRKHSYLSVSEAQVAQSIH